MLEDYPTPRSWSLARQGRDGSLTAVAHPRHPDSLIPRGHYHERREIESGCDELKTDMPEREEALRSRSPEGIYQELSGLLLVSTPLCLEMERTEVEAQVEPGRISLVTTPGLMRNGCLWLRGGEARRDPDEQLRASGHG